MDDEPAEKQLKQNSSRSNRKPEETMSKLAPSLKALINAPFARPGQTAAPSHIREVYQAIAKDAASKNVGAKPWLAISVRHTYRDFRSFSCVAQLTTIELVRHPCELSC